MTTATVRKVATDFLTREEPGVLALKGAWGVGKTHFWDSLVKDAGSALKPTRYCYASLFGIASKRELSIALYANVVEFKVLPREEYRSVIKNIGLTWRELIRLGQWCSRKYARYMEYNPFGEIPWVKNLPRSFEAFASQMIRDAVICLDDFERLDHEHFSAEELMGFINELKEKRGCKVVLIFNEGQLDGTKEIYEKYREKVIDLELLYAPTAQESAKIAVPPGTPCHDSLVQHAEKVGLTNIRVLRKIVRITKIMHTATDGLHQHVLERAVRTLVLFAWCYYEKNESKPTLDFIIGWNPYGSLFGKKAGSEENPQIEDWKKLLRDYGITIVEDFDLAIIAIIEKGYLEESGFIENAHRLDSQIQKGQNQADLDTVWEALNHSFENNQDEFVEVVRAKFNKHVAFISFNFLNSLVSLLRELDLGAFADKLITEYIAARKDETELFNLKKHQSGVIAIDPILKEYFQAQYATTLTPLTLDAAITYFITNNSWDDAQMKPLRDATEDEFYQCFKQHRGEDLTDFVRTCQRCAGFQGNEAIARKVHSALVRIGKENAINRFRVVHRFGITEEELDKSS